MKFDYAKSVGSIPDEEMEGLSVKVIQRAAFIGVWKQLIFNEFKRRCTDMIFERMIQQ